MKGVLLLWALLLLLLRLLGCVQASQLSYENTIIYGPGIDPKRCSLPVKYLYIQAVDKDGNNITDIDKSDFAVSFESTERVRYRSDTFNLGGGLLLYQYRIFVDLQSLTVHIKYRDKALAKSPYKLGPVFHEDCACPMRTPSEWLEDFRCPEVEAQVVSDLKAFKTRGIDVTTLYDRATKMFSRSSLVHYSIVNGTLYARTFGDIVGFKFLSDMILLSVVNKVVLPDMELIVNLGDWPLSKTTKKNSERAEPFPMFSWCGSRDSWDIVWPTWDLMKSTIMGLDRVSLSIVTAQRTLGNPPWDKRQSKAYFRGRDSNQARLDLVRDHHRNTEMFDVGITAWFFFDHDETVYGPKANRVGFHDFFDYKYQINIDGTVAAYRLPYLLAGGSLTIKQDSPYYEHFYEQLQPWVHYVPMKRDISDLRERVEWARDNDEQAREMAENAARFVQQNLLPEHLYCYLVTLLKEYSKLMVGASKIHPGMEPVVPEVAHDCTTVCQAVQSSNLGNTTSKQATLNKKQLPKEEL